MDLVETTSEESKVKSIERAHMQSTMNAVESISG